MTWPWIWCEVSWKPSHHRKLQPQGTEFPHHKVIIQSDAYINIPSRQTYDSVLLFILCFPSSLSFAFLPSLLLSFALFLSLSLSFALLLSLSLSLSFSLCLLLIFRSPSLSLTLSLFRSLSLSVSYSLSFALLLSLLLSLSFALSYSLSLSIFLSLLLSFSFTLSLSIFLSLSLTLYLSLSYPLSFSLSLTMSMSTDCTRGRSHVCHNNCMGHCSIQHFKNPWHYSPEEPRPTEAFAARYQYSGLVVNKALSLNLNFSFLNRISLLPISSTACLV